MKDPELERARTALIEWADVLTHNMRPGAAERVGLGYEQVHALNPRTVYLYAPGWGSTGPDAKRQSFAPMMSGYCGIGYEVGGEYNPPMWPLGNEDPGNGLLGAVGVLMALLHRDRHNVGTYVENPQLNATMTHAAHVVRTADGTRLGGQRLDPLQTGIGPLDRLYETRDGWLCVVACSDDEIRRLEAVTGVTILDNPKFNTHALRLENSYQLADMLGDVFAGRDTQEWVDLLTRGGVAAIAPKTDPNNERFHRDPVNHRIGRIAEVVGDNGVRTRESAHMVRVSDTVLPPHRLACALGADTDIVLRDIGYTEGHIAELRERKSIR